MQHISMLSYLKIFTAAASFLLQASVSVFVHCSRNTFFHLSVSVVVGVLVQLKTWWELVLVESYSDLYHSAV